MTPITTTIITGTTTKLDSTCSGNMKRTEIIAILTSAMPTNKKNIGIGATRITDGLDAHVFPRRKEGRDEIDGRMAQSKAAVVTYSFRQIGNWANEDLSRLCDAISTCSCGQLYLSQLHTALPDVLRPFVRTMSSGR